MATPNKDTSKASSSTAPAPTLDSFSPDQVNALLAYFSSRAKVSTTEEIIPTQEVRNVDAESVAPKLTPGTIATSSRRPAEKQDLSVLEPKSHLPNTSASFDMISPYADASMLYQCRKNSSTYIPSSLMMFYIITHMNDILSDSRAFRRLCPDYHPYIFRLYCGILFWIQCLRVGVHTHTVSGTWHQFLVRFLESHPLESLPVPSPLVTLFKTLCASQPEVNEYGPVAPLLPTEAGPARRDIFMPESRTSFLLPNVPGIFALLTDLNSKINAAANPVYPSKNKHIPVSVDAVTFGFHQFAAEAERTEHDKWSLISPGLEYDCEADKKMNEAFAERYSSFNFPAFTAADDLREIDAYLSMTTRTDWFGRVKDVASAVASVFNDSGTLFDCAVSGISANQYITGYYPTAAVLPAPTRTSDPAARFPFAVKAITSVRNCSQMTLALACAAQTNVILPVNHPYLNAVGELNNGRTGDFWTVNPYESSNALRENYIAIRPIIRRLYISKS